MQTRIVIRHVHAFYLADGSASEALAVKPCRPDQCN